MHLRNERAVALLKGVQVIVSFAVLCLLGFLLRFDLFLLRQGRGFFCALALGHDVFGCTFFVQPPCGTKRGQLGHLIRRLPILSQGVLVNQRQPRLGTFDHLLGNFGWDFRQRTNSRTLGQTFGQAFFGQILCAFFCAFG